MLVSSTGLSCSVIAVTSPPPAQETYHAASLAFDDTFRVMIVLAAVGALLGVLLHRNHAAQLDSAATSEDAAHMAAL